MNKQDFEKVGVFEKNILRNFYEPIKINKRRIKYNNGFYDMFKEPDVIKFIKIARLLWADHVIRIRIPNKQREHFHHIRKVIYQEILGSLERNAE